MHIGAKWQGIKLTNLQYKDYAILSVWWLAARPKTLAAGMMPVVMGAVLALGDGVFHAPSVVAAFCGALLIQIGTNYANDYFDFIKGTDTETRIGPMRATQAGLVAPEVMRNATIFVFLLVAIPAAYLVYRGGWPMLLIGLVSVLCGVLYTGGPYPLGYLGLGDIFVLIFFGPVAVAGTYFVQAQSLTTVVLLAGLAPGLFSTAILTVNNLRDRAGDALSGKKTLAVRFGSRIARIEYVVCLVTGGILIPLLLCYIERGRWWAMLSAISVLAAVPAMRTVITKEGETLNQELARTGKLLILFTFLFSAGWLL